MWLSLQQPGDTKMADQVVAAPLTVIIPCYRASKTVRRAFASVLAQTVLPSEVVVVDDYSNDRGSTVSALYELTQFSAAPHVEVVQLESNRGPATARNIGWGRATQEYVAFLDADDVWHPRKLELQLKWMRTHEDATFCSHGAALLKSPTDPWSVPSDPVVFEFGYRTLLPVNFVVTSSVLMRRDSPVRFAQSKRYGEDFLLWLTALSTGGYAGHVRAPLSARFSRTFGGPGLSGNLWQMERSELATYRTLHTSGRLGIGYYPLFALSLIKFSRRVGRVHLWRAISYLRGQHREIR
jgi:teichuronic acid biosynthesis glycosyltransferase TuaG